MDMWVLLKEKEKKRIKKQTEGKKPAEAFGKGENFFKNFLSSFLSQIHENMTVGFRRDKHEKCSARRWLRVSTRNTGFHREYR